MWVCLDRKPEFQNRGFGKSMMKAALAAAWAHGYRKVSLTVHPENPARSMQRACGFSEAGLRGTCQLMIAQRAGRSATRRRK